MNNLTIWIDLHQNLHLPERKRVDLGLLSGHFTLQRG